MRGLTFDKAIGGLIASVALFAVAFKAVAQNDTTATGALTAILAAAVGYYLRGRVQGQGGQ